MLPCNCVHSLQLPLTPSNSDIHGSDEADRLAALGLSLLLLLKKDKEH